MIKEVLAVVTQAGILKPLKVEPATISLIGIVCHLQHAYLDEARKRKNKSKRKEI